MAIATVIATQSAVAYGTASFTTGSGTCTTGRMLLCKVTGVTLNVGAFTGSISLSDSGGRTWTPWGPGLIQGTSANYRPFAQYFTAPVGTGASMTVTVDGAVSIYQWHVSVYEWDGNITTPLGATANNTGTNDQGALTLTLSSTPASNSITIGSTATSTTAAATVTGGAGFTESYEFNNAGGNSAQDQYDDTAPTDAVAWVDLCVGSTIDSNGWIAIAVELIAAAGVAPAPTVVASTSAELATSANPSVTFSSYTPLENDIIALYFGSTTTLSVVTNANLPAGWINPLGDGAEINSDGNGMGCVYHLVTAAEQTAVTLTYTATAALAAAELGMTHGVAIRGVDPTTPVDNFGTAQDPANTVTPHVLPAITGTGGLLASNSLVVSSVAKDGTGAYGTVPAGWTQLQATNTNQGMWTGVRNAATTASTDVAATNITPSAGDEYASIAVAWQAAPAPATAGLGRHRRRRTFLIPHAQRVR